MARDVDAQSWMDRPGDRDLRWLVSREGNVWRFAVWWSKGSGDNHAEGFPRSIRGGVQRFAMGADDPGAAARWE